MSLCLRGIALLLCLGTTSWLWAADPPPAPDALLMGFSPAASAHQRELETRFDAAISATDMTAWLRELSAQPHHAGSPGSKAVAQRVNELFNAWGFASDVVEYSVLLPTPVTRRLELLAPDAYSASLLEDPLAADSSTLLRDDVVPPYNAFSVDGDVESELVFVNYGIPEDYELLARHSIDVRGKIVIARYGKSWRGIKPKLAGEHGAIGAILYSDPADDGYGAGDTYPSGPFKHASAVQRGSVMDMPTYPGDVLTPGVGATANAQRLSREQARTITKIPVLPVSARDAAPLLAALGGSSVPTEWRGALPFAYHFGPGPARVRLTVAFDWQQVTAYNVIARLEGARHPEQWIVRGNHHDAWNHGAADPLSGLVALLAEARAVASLARAGDAPERSIVYAAWDAEEPGLIGSTEWAEHHAASLREHAVAYLNTDGNSRGFVNVGGSHTLERFFNQVLSDVRDPRLPISVAERRRALLRLQATTDEERFDANERADLRLQPLGSGSDYTPFLQHLGIASANIGFGGEGNGGSYHTLYDTFQHYTSWRDPGLTYGAALAQVAGRATLRLANAERLPFEFTALADNVARYIDEIEELATTQRAEVERTNRMLDDGTYGAALDPTDTLGPPVRHEPVPFFNLAPLHNALQQLKVAAAAYSDTPAPVTPLHNTLLYTSERLLTRSHGLPGRPWYKHHIYAPGFYTGYGVKTLPGVREAIEQREYATLDAQTDVVASVLLALTERIVALTDTAPTR